MKNKVTFTLSLLFVTFYWSCVNDFFVEIPEFDYPQTFVFSTNLSSYNIYDGELVDLTPSSDYHLLELSSTLFTDYSQKQRLIKVPPGYELKPLGDIMFDFPDETILVKTFYYYNDLRDTTLGKRVIETRVMIKSSGIWNSATYVWDDNQQGAILSTSGSDTEVSWIDDQGYVESTLYHIPDLNECITCHQSNSVMTPLGTTQVNLNRPVQRIGSEWNQLLYLQDIGIVSSAIDPLSVNKMVDYHDDTNSISDRGRAYLHMNCSHCHNPSGWEEAAEFDMDYRYETEFSDTGIEDEAKRIIRITGNNRMPYIGTTLFDTEGIATLVAYMESL